MQLTKCLQSALCSSDWDGRELICSSGNTGCGLDTRPKAGRNGAIAGVDLRERKESVRGREAASAHESVCGLKSRCRRSAGWALRVHFLNRSGMVLRQARLENTGNAVIVKAWAGAGAAMELAEETEVSSRTRVANQRAPPPELLMES